MGKRLPVLLFFCLYASTILAERILVMSPFGPRSHLAPILPMVEALAERGHKMTVLSAHEPKISGPNIHKIVLPELVELVETEWYDFKQHNLLENAVGVFQFFRSSFTVAYERFMANAEVKEIKRNKNYDLVIIDGIGNDFAFPLIDHMGVPFLVFDPGFGALWTLAANGVSREYAYIPPFLGNYGSEMSFFQRMSNMVISEILLIFRKHYLLTNLDGMAKKDFPNARPISEIEKNAELVFLNIHPTTTWLRPIPATFIPIGASHVRPPKSLPEDLQSFADGAEHGLIVFTLGSNSKVSSMPKHIQQIFFSVFARLPQRVLWKWELSGDDFPLPPNVKLVDWLPQQDLLGHNNTRLFIAHGGLMGNQEAIYHAVPILGLPLGRDQRLLLIKAINEGYAIKLEWEDITEEILYETIQRLLNEPSFKAHAKRMSRIMRDEIMPARDVAAYWVEHVLRHGGTKHLQSISKEMPFYQLYLLDVWIFLVSIFGLLIFAIFKLITLIGRRKSPAIKSKVQ